MVWWPAAAATTINNQNVDKISIISNIVGRQALSKIMIQSFPTCLNAEADRTISWAKVTPFKRSIQVMLSSFSSLFAIRGLSKNYPCWVHAVVAVLHPILSTGISSSSIILTPSNFYQCEACQMQSVGFLCKDLLHLKLVTNDSWLAPAVIVTCLKESCIRNQVVFSIYYPTPYSIWNNEVRSLGPREICLSRCQERTLILRLSFWYWWDVVEATTYINALTLAPVPVLVRSIFLSAVDRKLRDFTPTSFWGSINVNGYTDGASGYVFKLATIKVPHRRSPFLCCFLGVLAKPTISKDFDPYGSRQDLFHALVLSNWPLAG